MLLGFGEGATFPTATRAMQNWTAPGKRGFAQGITHAFARLGNAVAPPIVAFLIYQFGWRLGFVILGVASFAWVVVWFWYFRDDPKEHPAITPEELAVLPPPSKVGAKQNVPWGRLTRRMLPVTLTYFCYGWTLWLFLGWLPSFFKLNYGLDLKNSALFASGVFFAGVVGDTLGGVFSDRILKRTGDLKLARLSVIVVGFLGAAASLTGVFFTRDLTLVALLLSSGFFFAELVIGPIWSVPIGHRTEIFGHGGGPHEHRLGGGGDHLADRIRNDRGHDGELDTALRRLHRPLPPGRGPRLHHAPGTAVRRGTGGTARAGRAGGVVGILLSPLRAVACAGGRLQMPICPAETHAQH